MKCAACNYDDDLEEFKEYDYFIEILIEKGFNFITKYDGSIELFACPKCKTVRIGD